MMGYVLHIVPDSITNTKKAFVGSTKDIKGRTEYFAARAIDVREHLSVGRSDQEALAMLRATDLTGCGAVVFEYETYVESLRFLKQAHPGILRVIRAHNANLPHFVDQCRGRLRMGDPAEAVKDIDLALERLHLDMECADLADYVLSIAAFETHHYWGRLTDPRKVLDVPYFLPQTFATQIPDAAKRNLCVCFMGTGGVLTPLLYDAARNLIDLVNGAGAALADWDFVITGALKKPEELGALGRIRPTGLLPSPLPLLAEARVVTVLSDLGMGFKTKVLEAAMAGCWVLVTPDLYRRLPDAVRPWCRAVGLDSPAELVAALAECTQPPPPGNPNATFRETAFRSLDQVFAGLR